MNDIKKRPASAPVTVFRQGAIAASVWKRQATSGFEFFDSTISRSWKTSTTGKDQRQRSHLPYFDPLNAIDLIQLA